MNSDDIYAKYIDARVAEIIGNVKSEWRTTKCTAISFHTETKGKYIPPRLDERIEKSLSREGKWTRWVCETHRPACSGHVVTHCAIKEKQLSWWVRITRTF